MRQGVDDDSAPIEHSWSVGMGHTSRYKYIVLARLAARAVWISWLLLAQNCLQLFPVLFFSILFYVYMAPSSPAVILLAGVGKALLHPHIQQTFTPGRHTHHTNINLGHTTTPPPPDEGQTKRHRWKGNGSSLIIVAQTKSEFIIKTTSS